MYVTFPFSLPLLQGPSFAFFAPIIAFTKLPQFQCPKFGIHVHIQSCLSFVIQCVIFKKMEQRLISRKRQWMKCG